MAGPKRIRSISFRQHVHRLPSSLLSTFNWLYPSLNPSLLTKVVMASCSQRTTAHQESPAAIDGVARGTEQTGQTSSSSCLDLASMNPTGDVIQDSLDHADHLHGQSTLSNRQLYPVIYTKHHFEVLKLGVIQYAVDMISRHEERGVLITRKDIDRHWRRQVRREYNQSHPLWTTLQKQAGSLIIRSLHVRDADLASSQVPRLSNSLKRVKAFEIAMSWPHTDAASPRKM